MLRDEFPAVPGDRQRPQSRLYRVQPTKPCRVTLMFGGFLLLGGRLGGRGSVAGACSSPASPCSRPPRCSPASPGRRESLIAARALQGLGGGAPVAVGARDRDGHVRGGPGAQHRARRLGRDRRLRRRRRGAPWGHPHRPAGAGSGSSSSMSPSALSRLMLTPLWVPEESAICARRRSTSQAPC